MFCNSPDQIRAALRQRQAELHQCNTNYVLSSHKLRQDLMESERAKEMIALVKFAEDERRAQGHVDRYVRTSCVQEWCLGYLSVVAFEWYCGG